MDSDALAQDFLMTNRAIARCMHYLSDCLPEDKQGDFLLLYKDATQKIDQLEKRIKSSRTGKTM